MRHVPLLSKSVETRRAVGNSISIRRLDVAQKQYSSSAFGAPMETYATVYCARADIYTMQKNHILVTSLCVMTKHYDKRLK